MIGGAKGIGIGLDFGIGNQSRPKGSGKYLDPAVKEALCGIWIADQNTNDSPTRNIIKNKIANAGGDFEILNAAYKLNSGYGLYREDFTRYSLFSQVVGDISEHKIVIKSSSIQSWLFYRIPLNGDVISTTKIKIQGLQEGQKIRYYGNGSLLVYITDNGIYTVPGFTQNGAQGYGMQAGDTSSYNITVEEIPDYQGAFVTDGVDDMIVSQKSVSDMLGGSNELTVVSMIHQIELNSTHSKGFTNYIENIDSITSYVRTQLNVAGKTGIYGYTYNNATQLLINNILGDKNDYEKSLANATNIFSNSKFSVAGGINNTNTFSSVAWYWTLIAKRILTTDEINQVIAYYNLDKYVAPDVYYDVKKQGLTNENHADFGDKLIDYSGNGKDMQLYNFGWKLDSGVGKYEEDFTSWAKTGSLQINDNKITINNVSNFNAANWVLWKIHVTSNAFKVNIKGLPKNYNLIYEYRTEGDIYTTEFIIEEDGVYNLPASISTLAGHGFRVRVNDKSELVNYIGLTIEQLPSYENALVFDGVEDYGQYVGDLGLKDYTVVADRAYVELKTSQVPFISGILNTANKSPFLLEYTIDINKINPYSFGSYATLTQPINANRMLSYQSTYIYNGNAIAKGTSTDTGEGLTFGRYGANLQYAKLCLYNFMLFPYSLSEFLIERQLKKRKIGTLYPDMVEFRPMVKSNAEYKEISFAKGTSISDRIVAGQYLNTGGKLYVYVTPNSSSDKVTSITVNGIAVQDLVLQSNGVYRGSVVVNKSPQKININIDEYIRFEDIVQPYPIVMEIYNADTGYKYTWGDKILKGSYVRFKKINLLSDLYEVTGRIIYYPNENSLGRIINEEQSYIVEDFIRFRANKKYMLGSNSPKVVYSPSKYPIPNESLKILGYIPDLSGNGNHGKLNNFGYTAESGTDGNSIKFDGVEDFVSIPSLSSGCNQVLAKVNWEKKNSWEYLIDQRITTIQISFGYLTRTTSDTEIAYIRLSKTYLDGIINKSITSKQLNGVIHNITGIFNNSGAQFGSPMIGSNYANKEHFTGNLYDFMLFDEIDSDETIMKLNEAVGIENNIQLGGGPMIDFTTWKIVRNPVLEVTPTSIHVTNIKESNFFIEVQSMDLVIPSWKIKVTGVAKGRGVSYHYCKADGTYNQLWCEADGEYTLPESVHSQSQQHSGFRTNFIGDCDILIEQITN